MDRSWLRKSSRTGKALLSLGNNGLRQNCMIGIRIGRYKPSGLQDWEKILVGIAGLKNPIGNLLHFCQCETQTCGYFHCFGSEKSTMSLNGSSSKDGHYRGSQWQIVSIDARKFPVICANVQKVIFLFLRFLQLIT